MAVAQAGRGSGTEGGRRTQAVHAGCCCMHAWDARAAPHGLRVCGSGGQHAVGRGGERLEEAANLMTLLNIDCGVLSNT